MNPQHERILLPRHVAGRIRQDAVFGKAVRTRPPDFGHASQLQRGHLSIHVGNALRPGSAGPEIVQFVGASRLGSHESDGTVARDAALRGDDRVHDRSERQSARGSVERLHEQRPRRPVVRLDQQRAVRQPRGSVHETIERLRHVAIARAVGSDRHRVFEIHRIAAALVEIEHACAVGRIERLILKSTVRRELPRVARSDVESEDETAALRCEDAVSRSQVQQFRAVRRPRDCRVLDAPRTLRQAAFAAGEIGQPQMRRLRGLRRQIGIVRHFEGVFEMRRTRGDRWYVAAHKGDRRTVRTPREIEHVGAARQAGGLFDAALRVHDVDAIAARGIARKKRKPRSVGRPRERSVRRARTWNPTAAAVGDGVDPELVVVAVLRQIRTLDDVRDARAVRRDGGTRNLRQPVHGVQRERRGECGGAGESEHDDEQSRCRDAAHR